MKRIINLVFIVAIILMSKYGQAQGINFQGVARSANGTILAGSNISLKLSIISKTPDATPDFVETKTVLTNAQGIFSIIVGDASNKVVLGSFASINWADQLKFLKVEMDPTGGVNFISMGTTQLQNVPFSYYSLGVDAANIAGTLSVAKGGTGVASIAGLKTALTLNSVNNTTDLAKPISTLTQTALDLKLNAADTSKYTKQTYSDSALVAKQVLIGLKLNAADTSKYTKQIYSDSAMLTKLSTTGNAATATTAGNITATTNTTLTSLSNLATVGTITSGVWSGTAVAVEKGGTGLTAAGTNGQVLTSTGSGTLTWTGTHYIGESYGGGIVFYVYDNGKHGLIAAKSDQSTGIRWYGGSNTNTRARADGVGAGLKNTAIIIANQGAVDGNAFAATLCNEYSVTVDGVKYGDWYLPSKYELNLLYLQQSVVGGFALNFYWSSTEIGNSSVWDQYFQVGSQGNANKNGTGYIRAIRAF